MPSQTYVYLNVPSNVNLSQFTDVQRGTIFMWLVTVTVITVVTGVKLFSGNLDPEGEKYEQGKEASKDKNGTNLQSSESFDKAVIKSQVMTEDDSGTMRLMKKITKFATVLVPLTLTFALGLSLGVTYAFSLVLYFLIMIPLILFNVLELHKWMFDHKVFICIFDNLWLVFSFFWLLNVWTTGKFMQPYLLTQFTINV